MYIVLRVARVRLGYSSVPFRNSFSNQNTKLSVSIGDVAMAIKTPRHPELVPVVNAANISQSALSHLRWMLQKDMLKQDMFLVGGPGPYRRTLAMMFCNLIQREVEYVSLSRDTTESDLKQRREIRLRTAEYINQSAVRAALEGRVLILEGIEKAERNVLPVLNNLLENREMQLENGNFLLAPEKYDKLKQNHTQSEMDQWKLQRVHEDFRVVALGLPVPPYRGNTLDPPLRSRFQARFIPDVPYQECLSLLSALAPAVESKKLSALLSVASTLQMLSQTAQLEFSFPMNHLENLVKILNNFPEMSVQELLHFALPGEIISKGTALKDTLSKFRVHTGKRGNIFIDSLKSQEDYIEISIGGASKGMLSVCGYLAEAAGNTNYVSLSQHENALAEVMLLHATGDFCIVGGKGCGKTTLVQRFADCLGYQMETIAMYQDMTARDLLQYRITHPNGDTFWKFSSLVNAAIDGKLVVLDGVHRSDIGTLAQLQGLIHDRELTLFGGERLVGEEKYDEIRRRTGFTDAEMKEKNIYPISKKLRIIALAEPSGSSNRNDILTNPEFHSMFLFQNLLQLNIAEERNLVKKKVPNVNRAELEKLLSLVSSLRSSNDQVGLSLSNLLSTRQLLRIAKRQNSEGSLFQAISRVCLIRFLPTLAKEVLEREMEKNDILPNFDVATKRLGQITCQVCNNVLTIGSTSQEIKKGHNKAGLVPNVLFYENAQHLHILEDMLKDFSLGEHLLLVGNQGVGKNKLVDHLLHLLNLPREYLQLHRDTTVQSLTQQSAVKDGQIVYEDSPLVRAVRNGLVLVVDEADKAPTHVTCILKNLLEMGEMTLSDGRKIVPRVPHQAADSERLIPIHGDFRMVALANRPGFPFLGNDFYAAMGDMFACHSIDNPDLESEKALLKRYGPDVPDFILEKLVRAFSDLREMADEGLITYPYSTREVINIVRHLQHFPAESITEVVQNVFGFDSYHEEMKTLVFKTLHKYGIPAGASPGNINLAKKIQIPTLTPTSKLSLADSSSQETISVSAGKLKLKGPLYAGSYYYPLDKLETRGLGFSEMVASWKYALDYGNFVTGISVSRSRSAGNDVVHVNTGNPIGVYSTTRNGPVYFTDLSSFYPSSGRLKTECMGLPGGHFLHFSANNCDILLVNPQEGHVQSFSLKSVASRLTHQFVREQPNLYKLNSSLAEDNIAIFQETESNQVHVVDLSNKHIHRVIFPRPVENILCLDRQSWIIKERTGKLCLFSMMDDTAVLENLVEVGVKGGPMVTEALNSASTLGPSARTLGQALHMEVDEMTPPSYSRLASGSNVVAVLTGLPVKSHTAVSVHSINLSNVPKFQKRSGYSQFRPSLLSKEAQIICPFCSSDGRATLEVIDLPSSTLSSIKLNRLSTGNENANHSINAATSSVFTDHLSDSLVVAVDSLGNAALLETSSEALDKSLKDWKRMAGLEGDHSLQLTINRESGLDVSGPKHGKVDPEGTPHVGGNTWAGGTGGRDTAGLGGKGGPYRLDAGHPVYQVSDAEKDSVPEEVKQAAREMGQKAFLKRLEEIRMTPHDAELYERLKLKVKRQTLSISALLESLQARGLERQWLRHQTSGDLDDTKLIDGLTGEKSIYKRRGEKEPEYGSPQLLPKRIRLVVDVSGSMYRFNGHDQRLDRMLEAVLMVMEAFSKQERKFKLEVYGHSGDSAEIKFISSSNPPVNEKERLDILKEMHAHSQYCWPGDHTLEATQKAVEEIVKEPADEYTVIVISDANFSRYRIKPETFAKIMSANPQVNVFAIFIGSLGDQAEVLKEDLPQGQAFVCMDNKDLPLILQRIFTATLK